MQDNANFRHLNRSVYNIALIAVFGAFIFVFTAFVHFPVGMGYVHLGDIFIFLACAFLSYYAVIPSAIGSVLADIFLGYSYYAPATLVIKALMPVIMLLIKGKKHSNIRILIGMIVASVFMQIGYTSYEVLLVAIGNPNASTYAAVLAPLLILSNFSQTLFGVAGGWILIKVSQKLKLFDRIKVLITIEKENHE
ncbi:MAG TPA: ECF transporter S component [Clostridia bacterium]|jgi:uncharacterized membrane protein